MSYLLSVPSLNANEDGALYDPSQPPDAGVEVFYVSGTIYDVVWSADPAQAHRFDSRTEAMEFAIDTEMAERDGEIFFTEELPWKPVVR
jgi:hypothetical protein